jgi:hypothetical protein
MAEHGMALRRTNSPKSFKPPESCELAIGNPDSSAMWHFKKWSNESLMAAGRSRYYEALG